MPRWLHKLDLKDLGDADRDDTSPQHMARIVADRLDALGDLTPTIGARLQERKVELVDSFRDAADDTLLTYDHLDYLTSDLYDWGDVLVSGNVVSGSKVCWVATF